MAKRWISVVRLGAARRRIALASALIITAVGLQARAQTPDSLLRQHFGDEPDPPMPTVPRRSPQNRPFSAIGAGSFRLGNILHSEHIMF